jgi:biopolymer transport protein ExbB
MMEQLRAAWQALRYGGVMVYPLSALGIIAVLIILDRAIVCARTLHLPARLLELVKSHAFDWEKLDGHVRALGPYNAYGKFFEIIISNRDNPAWWVESRAGDEAGRIEKLLNRGLWVLETIVTAAPLLGLLGTITGMMQAFRIVGLSQLVAPTQVTAGVAQALIATALGLLIAVIALFAFNFFSRMHSHALDTMERLGTRLVDHIRLDEEKRMRGGSGVDPGITETSPSIEVSP